MQSRTIGVFLVPFIDKQLTNISIYFVINVKYKSSTFNLAIGGNLQKETPQFTNCDHVFCDASH